MAFNWLDDFHKEMAKRADYAAKTLAAYRLGMKAGGSIVGVRVQVGETACEPARAIDPQEIFHPDDAPNLPLEGCPIADRCQCVYRPVMVYQVDPAEAERLMAANQARLAAERLARRQKGRDQNEP